MRILQTLEAKVQPTRTHWFIVDGNLLNFNASPFIQTTYLKCSLDFSVISMQQAQIPHSLVCKVTFLNTNHVTRYSDVLVILIFFFSLHSVPQLYPIEWANRNAAVTWGATLLKICGFKTRLLLYSADKSRGSSAPSSAVRWKTKSQHQLLWVDPPSALGLIISLMSHFFMSSQQ